MSYALSATLRPATSRVQDERLNSRIPAIVYGRGAENQQVIVTRSEFLRIFSGARYSSLIDLAIDGGASVKVLIKEIQYHPLRLDPIHVDFQRIRMDEEMTVVVPLHFVGESAAVKVLAGTLLKSLDKMTVRCLPNDLPAFIDVDISSLKTFNDSITVADLPLPKGVVAVTAGNVTITTVAAPLTEDELKRLEQGDQTADVTAIKTEGEEKKAAEEAKKAEEASLDKKEPKKDAKK